MDKDRLRRGLNDIAIRCFRDMADQDYIAARLAYRAGLHPQFFWSSQQALEKYLKCILLINRVPAKTLRHDLGAALRVVERSLPSPIDLLEITRRFIARIDEIGRFRYFEVSWHSEGRELFELDFAVWELRRFCQVFQNSEMMIRAIALSRLEKPIRFSLIGGRLEEILKNRAHPARSALVWKNFRFGQRHRAKLLWTRSFSASNSPFWLRPEIADEAARYIHLPKELTEACRELWRQQQSAAPR